MNIPAALKLPKKIIISPGALLDFDATGMECNSRVLLVTGQNFPKRCREYPVFLEKLKNLVADVSHFQVPHEPSPGLIDGCVQEHRSNSISTVIGIGGGSVLDTAKAVSCMLTEEGSVVDYLEGVGTRSPKGSRVGLVLVPTTSGTGSEATCNGVISSVGPNGFKKSLRHDNFLPDLALVDPALMRSCPPQLTASCGMDCFTQLVEGYLSTRANSFTDQLALDGISAVLRSLEACCTDGDKLQPRQEMAYATLLSGIVLTNAGLGTVHGFASVIGGLFEIPHGAVCGRLMGSTNRVNLMKLRMAERSANDGARRPLAKYARLGRLVRETRGHSRFTGGQEPKTDHWYQELFLEELDRLTEALQLPGFRTWGITADHIPEIVEKTANKNNPIILKREDLARIIEDAL